MVRQAVSGIVTVVALMAALGGSGPATGRADRSPADGPELASQLRRPIALALIEGEHRLFVANQRSGTISVIDTRQGRVVAEASVGRRLADLVVTPDGRLLAVDEQGHDLLVLERRGDTLRVTHRVPVSPFPVSVSVAPDGKRCFVASLWSRRLSAVDPGTADPRVVGVLDLPFAPRRQFLLPGDGRLVVADSFGGQLAVVDTARLKLESVREIPAHNIRGLALGADGQQVLLAHQLLNGQATTAFDDIHWGNLLTNNLRVVPRADLLDGRRDLTRNSRLDYLGDVGHGAADPSGLAVRPGGGWVVSLGGVDALLVSGTNDLQPRRLAVGRRPTAVVVAPDGRRAYVANTFSDSVSVVDLAAGKVEREVRLGPSPAPTASDRGELLFFDARLSHDGWLSCQSCHTDGHTNGRLNDNLTDGTYGTPKRVLSLLGVKDTPPWAWNGRMKALEDQMGTSVRSTMQGKPPSAKVVADLVAYLRTLTPPPSLESMGRGDPAAARRGKDVFARLGCARCHRPPTYTSAETYDVGLADEAGLRHFNPPSLRGVSQGGPYFHDNRAATLTDVFVRYRHELREPLPERALHDLMDFLRSL